ncbi:MAG: peptidyl-prolyl cis-trans isomerase [Candidatus Cloacimonetes bacterium]|nr:peptidyl-prolyl cis-trans isomerase [Candidatus Cloacimonadota bacterium]
MRNNNNSVKIFMTIFCLIAVFSSVVLLADNNQQQQETIFAEYRGGKITRADFDEEFQKIPHMYRARFSTLAGQKELLNSIIISRLFFFKAEELGIDQRDDVNDAIESALKDHYAMEFRKRDISDRVIIPQEEVSNYYEQSKDRFTENPNIVIRYIMPENAESAEKAKQALLAGEDFIDVMNSYSINSFSKRHQGVIRNIRGNSYIAGVGMDEELDEAITAAPLNTWIGPLTTETGIHIFQVTERIPQRVKPLDEVREEIISRLKPVKDLEMTQRIFKQLKDKYSVQIDNDLLESVNLPEARPDPERVDLLIATANIPDLQITVGDFVNHMRRVTQQERAQLSNPQYRKDLFDNLLMNNLFAFEAKQKGYGEFLKENLEAEQIRRNIILNHLFNELVVTQAIPTQEDIESHYNENIDRYTTNEQRTIQLFLFDNNRTARRAKNDAAKAYRNDNHDKITEVIGNSLFTENNGLIANIQRDPNIPRIGKDEIMHQVIWNTKVNEISEVTKNADDKYFFLKVLDEIPAHTFPLADAEERITFQLTRELRERKWAELQEELKAEYALVSYPERLAFMFSARELFDLAEEAMKRNRYREAIQYYDQIIDTYKNNDDDYKALFMKGFVMAEELQNPQEAVKIFQDVIRNYPAADLHESAEYMIKSIEEGFDVFDDLK